MNRSQYILGKARTPTVFPRFADVFRNHKKGFTSYYYILGVTQAGQVKSAAFVGENDRKALKHAVSMYKVFSSSLRPMSEFQSMQKIGELYSTPIGHGNGGLITKYRMTNE